ncbi:Brix domain-containing protein [Methanobacterium sp. CWC-01]|uniref:Brix domain-containing protein n=1 Tax=Methanobacterium aridiramus TaxID=2584467 RepID=UPI0025762598|nr:Brix domain-containing protein [Methanobacterium sp. CWC-01]WJI09033.1 Brix domain-containing protein [Methanobacterium sp. CWC-01]
MLITTSRKPSQRTRSFGRALERVLPARYLNRGKMSLREVFLKAKELGFDSVMVISERYGNPSRLEFFTGNEEPEAYILISTDLSQPSGKIHTENLTLQCEEPALSDFLSNFLKIGLDSNEISNYKSSNLICIKKTGQTQRTVMEFFDNKGNLIRPRIYLKDWKGVAFSDSSGS